MAALNLLSFSSAALCSQEETSYSQLPVIHLDQAAIIQQMLEKNYQIRVMEYSPRIAATEISEAQGRFDPRVDLRYFSSRDDSPQTADPFTNVPDTFAIEQDQLSLGVGGILDWGTIYRFDLSSNNRRGTFNDFADEVTTFTGFTITQPLLRSFGVKPNRARIEIARAGLELSYWEVKNTIMAQIEEAVFAYNELFFAMKNLEVARRSRDLARKLLEDNQRRVKIGSMARLEIIVAEAELALREERVLLAHRRMLDQENRLRLLIFDDVEQILDRGIAIAPPPPPELMVAKAKRDFAYALRHHPDYQQALLGISRNRLEETLATNTARPTLDLIGRYGLLGRGGSFANSLTRLSNTENQSYSLGLAMNVPFPNREGRSRVAAARLTTSRAEIGLKRLQQIIILTLDNLAGRIATNWNRIRAAEKASILSQESLLAEEKKLQAGTSTTFVVLELQEDLARAEVRELEAITDYNRALAQYERESGKSLPNHGITLQDMP